MNPVGRRHVRERLDRALAVEDSERADRHVAIQFGRAGFDSVPCSTWAY